MSSFSKGGLEANRTEGLRSQHFWSALRMCELPHHPTSHGRITLLRGSDPGSRFSVPVSPPADQRDSPRGIFSSRSCPCASVTSPPGKPFSLPIRQHGRKLPHLDFLQLGEPQCPEGGGQGWRCWCDRVEVTEFVLSSKARLRQELVQVPSGSWMWNGRDLADSGGGIWLPPSAKRGPCVELAGSLC